MKIPFLPYHIHIIKIVVEGPVTGATAGKVDQLIKLLHEAKVGHVAKGRRKALRKALQKAYEIRAGAA